MQIKTQGNVDWLSGSKNKQTWGLNVWLEC